MERETSAQTPVGREELEQALKRAEELQEALDSRIVIEQAKGVLRERFGWDVGDAFEILRYASRSSRTKIHELAQAVVDSDDTPQAIVVALARGARWRAAGMRERAEALHARADDLDARIQAQRQRMAAWPARDGRPRDGRRPEPLPRRRTALRVVAPTYEAARMLLQRTSIVF